MLHASPSYLSLFSQMIGSSKRQVSICESIMFIQHVGISSIRKCGLFRPEVVRDFGFSFLFDEKRASAKAKNNYQRATAAVMVYDREAYGGNEIGVGKFTHSGNHTNGKFPIIGS